MGQIAPLGKAKYFDSNGVPLAGGKLYTYAAGTTAPLATYSDKAETAPNANPIILDANGEATIFLSSAAYKFVLKTPADVTMWTVDGIATINDGSITNAKLVPGILSNDIPGHALMADGYLSNDTPGHAKMADGYLSADTAGRAKMADGYLSNNAEGHAKMVDGYLSADTAGRAKMADGFVNQAKRANLGQQISASCGTFNTTSSANVDIPNLAVTITTTGRPVYVGIQPDGNVNNGAYVGVNGANGIAQISILRATTVLGSTIFLRPTT
jgi:hypothetical protein